MPPKSAKKKPSAKPRKSPAASRATSALVKEDENLLVRLRQTYENALNARNELPKQVDGTCRESKEQAAARVAGVESLLNVIPIPIWIARTPDCRHITGNRAAAELIGAPMETNVSQTPGEHPVKVPMVCLRAGRKLAPPDLPMQQAAASGQPGSDDFEMVLPDGRVKSLRCAIPLVRQERDRSSQPQTSPSASRPRRHCNVPATCWSSESASERPSWRK
jgi:PAS domain-containing protein